MKCECKNCDGTGNIECPECDGTGELDINEEDALPKHDSRRPELLRLISDEKRAKESCLRLTELKPEHAATYVEQLNRTLAEIGRRKEELMEGLEEHWSDDDTEEQSAFVVVTESLGFDDDYRRQFGPSLRIQYSREIGNHIDEQNRKASRQAVETHNSLHPAA